MQVQEQLGDGIIHKCLHPQIIRNQYDGKEYVVPCRSCAACLNQRSNRLRQMVDDEFKFGPFKYPLFITLSYAPEHLPVFYRCYNEDDSISPFYISSRGRLVPAKYIDIAHLPSQPFKDFALHIKNHDKEVYSAFASFDVVDIQNFLKRLRITISRRLGVKNNAFRYFFMAEYGSLRFRPHYHGILWCSTPQVQEFILSLLDSSSLPDYARNQHGLSSLWKNGRTDCQIPRINEASGSYVSSYVSCLLDNSSLNVKGFRPFYLASKSPYIGSRPVELASLETVLHDSVQNLSSPSALYSKKSSDGVSSSYVLYSPSCRYSVFPKCDGFNNMAFADRVQKYSLLSHFSEDADFQSVEIFYKKKDKWIPSRFFVVDGKEVSVNDFHCARICQKYCNLYHITPFRYVEILSQFYVSYYSYILGNQCNLYSKCYELYKNNSYIFLSDLVLARDILDEVTQKGYYTKHIRDVFSSVYPSTSDWLSRRQFDKFINDNHYLHIYEEKQISSIRTKHHTRYSNEYYGSVSW